MGDRPDLLRVERFGAAYYARRRTAFFLLPQPLAQLLAAARHESALVAYARAPGATGLSEEALIAEVCRWQNDGLLDADYRCRAALVDNPSPQRALAAPLVTSIELTRACNLRCAHCYVDLSAKRSPLELRVDEVEEIFAALQGLGSPVVVLAGGEPLLRDDLGDLLAALPRYAIDAFLCTNATLIDEGAARSLAASAVRGFSISLDGPDATTHEVLRGRGSFARALAGIDHLVRAGAREVKLRVTVTANNASRLSAFGEVARELGVSSVAFKPFRQLGAASEQTALGLSYREYTEATARLRDAWPADGCAFEVDDGVPERYAVFTGLPTWACVGGTTSLTITADARVIACGAVDAPDAWSLREHSLAECWRAAPSLVAWRHLAPEAFCHACAERLACGGGCRARAAAIHGSLGEPDDWACLVKGARRA